MSNRDFLFNYQPAKNGLYPAVPFNTTKNKDMEGYWIRDNYWIWRTNIGNNKFGTAIKNIFDAYKDLIKIGKVFPVKYDKIPYIQIKEWSNFQLDAYANMLEVLAQHREKEKVKEMMKYVLKLYPKKESGIWEEEKKYNPYSFACLARAFRKVDELDIFDSKALASRFENIALTLVKGGEPDLQNLLLPLMTKQFFKHRQEIVAETLPLMGEHGVKRYEGDRWSGVERDLESEPEWTLGYLAMKHYMPMFPVAGGTVGEKAEGYEDLENGVPESFIDGEPNENQPLIWAEALAYGSFEQVVKWKTDLTEGNVLETSFGDGL